jgi:hypothetical protein
MKIGDLSRELETNEYRLNRRDTDDAPTKTETLEAAGINIRTAERYEELTGGLVSKSVNLSRELETAKTGPKLGDTDDAQLGKTEMLEAAGINIRTALTL